MRSEGIFPDAITYVAAWRHVALCKTLIWAWKFMMISFVTGFQKRRHVDFPLMDINAKCDVHEAQHSLRSFLSKVSSLWSTLIVRYTNKVQGKEALGCCQQMWNEGISPDAIFYMCILETCGSMQNGARKFRMILLSQVSSEKRHRAWHCLDGDVCQMSCIS